MGRYKPLKKRGVKSGKMPPWTTTEERRLIRLWVKGLSTPEIAGKFAGTRTFHAIKNRLCVLRGRGRIR